jgi:cysteinyl-tRNA synthetase
LSEQDLYDLFLIDTKMLKLGLFDAEVEGEIVIPSEIQALAEQRRQAKADKNWAEADRIRKDLEEK